MDSTVPQRFIDDLTIANERFDLLTKASHDVIWDWDLEQDIIFWNEAYHTLLGYADYESPKLLDSWSDYIHPDDKKQVVASLKKAISRGKPNGMMNIASGKQTDRMRIFMTGAM